MAKLRKPREEVRKALAARIQAGKDLTAKAEIAEKSWGHDEWLFLFKRWREERSTRDSPNLSFTMTSMELRRRR